MPVYTYGLKTLKHTHLDLDREENLYKLNQG